MIIIRKRGACTSLFLMCFFVSKSNDQNITPTKSVFSDMFSTVPILLRLPWKITNKSIITLEGRLGTCAECWDYPMLPIKILIFVSTKTKYLRIIPGKNPKVYQNYFMTDELTQGERVRLGRELSKSPRLKQYGKKVMSFRLFEGKSVEQKMLFT